MQINVLTSLLARIGLRRRRPLENLSTPGPLKLSLRPSRVDPERKAFIRALGRRQGIKATKLARRARSFAD